MMLKPAMKVLKLIMRNNVASQAVFKLSGWWQIQAYSYHSTIDADEIYSAIFQEGLQCKSWSVYGVEMLFIRVIDICNQKNKVGILWVNVCYVETLRVIRLNSLLRFPYCLLKLLFGFPGSKNNWTSYSLCCFFYHVIPLLYSVHWIISDGTIRKASWSPRIYTSPFCLL